MASYRPGAEGAGPGPPLDPCFPEYRRGVRASPHPREVRCLPSGMVVLFQETQSRKNLAVGQ